MQTSRPWRANIWSKFEILTVLGAVCCGWLQCVMLYRMHSHSHISAPINVKFGTTIHKLIGTEAYTSCDEAGCAVRKHVTDATYMLTVSGWRVGHSDVVEHLLRRLRHTFAVTTRSHRPPLTINAAVDSSCTDTPIPANMIRTQTYREGALKNLLAPDSIQELKQRELREGKLR